MTVHFFDNVSEEYDNANVSLEHLDGWLEINYPDETERAAKRAQIIQPDGTLSKFQVVTQHRMAKETQGVTIERPEPPINDFLTAEMIERDVPTAVYDDPLPNIAAGIKQRVGIISAVRKWGKPQASIKDHRTEGIKIRCPFEHHVDHRPSAWANTSNNTWYCGKCMVGGDVIDFWAARQKGLEPKDFHKTSDFHTLVNEMGEELGFRITKTGPETWEVVDDEVDIPSPLPDRSEKAVEPPARSVPVEADAFDHDEHEITETESVVPPSPEADEPRVMTDDETLRGIAFSPEDLHDDEDDDEVSDLVINWRNLPINPGSFLGMWLQHSETWNPWVAPEYYFWLGVQAIGIAMGHHVQSTTGGQLLSGSLMVSIIGSSGSGKSTAVRDMRAMFNRIGITQFNMDDGTGIKQISNPGSGEALVGLCRHEIPDDVDPTKKEEVGITTWMYVDEMADFASKASRLGGANLKTNLLALYDFVKTKDEPELVIDEYSLGSGRRVLHDTFFSATFTTQTDAIRMLMTKTDLISGFLNRIIPVSGHSRERRKSNAETATSWAYDQAYESLYRRCRDGKKHIPFTDAAFEFIDNSPLFTKMERLAAADSLFVRVQHLTFRLALLLAVNNGEKQVDEMYVVAAAQLASEYVIGSYTNLRTAVIANEVDDAAQRIVQWTNEHYYKYKRWPNYTQWANSRAFRSFDGEARKAAMETLHREYRLVIVRLKKAAGVGAPKNIMVVPTGEWVGYATMHMKTITSEAEFYA